MDLLRLSLKLDFKTTAKILKDIVSDDKKISDLAREFTNYKIFNDIGLIPSNILKIKRKTTFRDRWTTNYYSYIKGLCFQKVR